MGKLLTEEQRERKRQANKAWRAKNPLTEEQRERQRQAKAKFMAKPEARARQQQAHMTWRANNPLRWMLARARQGAQCRALEFSIVEADFGALPTHCPVLGLELKYAKERATQGDPAIASLDRKDNSKGYIPGNVFIVSSRANTLKGSASIAELEALLKYMKE